MQFTGEMRVRLLAPWQQDGQRALSATCVVLLTVLLMLIFGFLTQAPVPNDPKNEGADNAEQQTAIQKWQALWSDIDRRGEAAFLPEQPDSSLRSAGDTVFMRYRRLWREVDESARHTLQMAALANDPQRKLALLRPLTTIDNAQVRFRALLEMARVYLRLRALDEARATAQQALAIPDLNPKWLADADFILGYSALEARDFESAEAALARAVGNDPGFWDARQIQLLVLAHQLGQERQSVAACLNRTRLMIRNLGAMPALAQDRTQFRDIADRFAAQSAPVNSAFSLLSGLGYLWAGEQDKAQTALREVGQRRGKLPRPCEVLLIDKANEWLNRHF